MTTLSTSSEGDMQFPQLPKTAAMSVPEAAAEWRLYGWHPVPVNRTTRVPYVTWRNGTQLSPAQIKRQFEELPECLLAIALPRNIVVLDIDHRPRSGWDAANILMRLGETYGLPACPTAYTPKGGVHLWFSLPSGFETRNWTSQHGRLGIDGVDIRTRGGLITVPPSNRLDGYYSWLQWMAVPPLAPVPLLRNLKPHLTPSIPSRAPLPSEKVSAYVTAAYAAELAAVVLSSKGGRNDQLFRSAAALGTLVGAGVLPEQHVYGALLKAAHKCGLTQCDGLRTVEATIRSGLRAGKSHPRLIPELRK